MIVKPKDAATIMLLQPCRCASDGNFEVLMVLRHPQNKFVADSYVFPGGALDKQDGADFFEAQCRGINRISAGRIIPDMPSPVRALAAWVAAVRETFEEVGMMLAYDQRGSLLSLTGEEAERFSRYRHDLNAGKTDFERIVSTEGLTLATDRIFYYSHWITPEASPIRYNVRFFAAQAPEGQVPLHDGFELTRHVWITPQEALRDNAKGNFRMVLPTIMTMKELALYKSVEDVIQSTRNKKIPAILTKLIKKDNEIVEIMPDGDDCGPCPV
jgi:8-oxo-dGTP pyrophosphatase MutT (NUDIX family)